MVGPSVDRPVDQCRQSRKKKIVVVVVVFVVVVVIDSNESN